MEIKFVKYQGCGNDFILIDNRGGTIHLDNTQTEILCDRHFGIGADGLMLLENTEGYDYKMVYFNSDGNLSSLCGNGSRCMAAFAKQLGIITGNARFLAADGAHEVLLTDKEIALKMNDVTKIDDRGNYFFLDTGSPHVVKWVDKLEAYDVFTEGKIIRRSEEFNAKGGTNVNFIERKEDALYIRTYERGVENETLACGTGVTAAALVAALENKSAENSSCKVRALGGYLRVDFIKNNNSFTDIWLKGPAEFVFEGKISI